MTNSEKQQNGRNARFATQKDEWMNNMRTKYPDIQDEDALYGASMSGYDKEHEYGKRSREENQHLAETLESDPQLAALYQEMYERGKDGHPELALLNIGDLLKSLLNGDINTDEYIAEKGRRAADKKKYDDNVANQQEFVRQWCEQKGYDFEEWAQKVKEKLFEPFTSFTLAEAQLEAIDNMLNYDEDVAAAEVRGRNAKISEQRRKVGASDGLPSGASPAASTRPNKRSASIFDIANGEE